MKQICYESIKGLHLELTTKCNACCPMCSRNYKGKVRKNLEMTELTLENCKKIFSSDFINQLELISLCGVYGDPILATEIFQIIDYFYCCNEKLHINLYTNGSLHSEDWWSKLAKKMKNGIVVFGIDGIGDINSIHRQNTNYEKVINNAKAYIKAGGRARWDYIVFKHNEDQVYDARKISEELGFEIFQVKKTSRFIKNLYENDPNLDSTIFKYGEHPIFNAEGTCANKLELPTKKEYRNNAEDTIFELIDKYQDLENYFDLVEIDCSAIKTKGIFVSAFGEVFPCCTVYQQVRYGDLHRVEDSKELNEYKIFKKDNLSAFELPIKSIIEGIFFNKLQSNWCKVSIKKGKPKSCCRTCGKNVDTHSGQHEKIQKEYM